jgi:hypothetical protein
VACGSSGGGVSLLLGAPECNSIPYRRETIPTNSVTSNVLIRVVGSSCFFFSNIALFLKIKKTQPSIEILY